MTLPVGCVEFCSDKKHPNPRLSLKWPSLESPPQKKQGRTQNDMACRIRLDIKRTKWRLLISRICLQRYCPRCRLAGVPAMLASLHISRLTCKFSDSLSYRNEQTTVKIIATCSFPEGRTCNNCPLEIALGPAQQKLDFSQQTYKECNIKNATQHRHADEPTTLACTSLCLPL